MNLPLVILLTVLVHAAFNGSRLTVSLAAHSLHATPLTIGVLMSLYAAIPMLYSVTAGRFVDKVGAAKPMFWAAVAVGVGLMIGWLWHSIWALYVVALIVGTGFMVFHVAANSLVGGMGGAGGAEGDENRSVRFSWFALGFSISGFTSKNHDLLASLRTNVIASSKSGSVFSRLMMWILLRWP